MGEILSWNTIWADVLSLGPPDRCFMTSFKNTLAAIAELAGECEEPVIIMMVFGWVNCFCQYHFSILYPGIYLILPVFPIVFMP